jgi:RimJ/RimL family protein N-acetyltransferase
MRTDITGIKAAGGLPFASNEYGIRNWITNLYPKNNPTTITLAVTEAETGDFVGYASALNISYLNRNAHVGFFFHKNGQGKGYFKETQIIFYAYLFQEINLHKVYSYALEYNEFVIAVDKKIGFKEEGVMQEHIYQGGEYHNAIMLGLTAKDFYILHKIKDIIIT